MIAAMAAEVEIEESCILDSLWGKCDQYPRGFFWPDGCRMAHVHMTGSKIAMGALGMAFGIPEVVVRFFGAPMIDRVNRVRLMALLDLVRFGCFGALFVLGSMHWLMTWHMYAIAVLVGSCSAIFGPASMAVLPSIVPKEQSVRSFALMDASGTVSMLLGPILATNTIALFGSVVSIGVDAVSFLVSSVLIFQLSRMYRQSRGSTQSTGVLMYLRETLDGVLFYKYAKSLLLIQSLVSIKNMSTVGAWSMMVPYGREHLHTNVQGIGMISTASSVGLVIGILIVSWIGDVRHRRFLMLGSIFLQGVFLILLGFVTNLWVAMVVMALLSSSGPFFSTLSSSLYVQMVPEQLRGRVMSARLLVGGSLQPIGSYGAGLISQAFSVPTMFVAFGVIPVVGAAIGYASPVLRHIDGAVREVKLPERTPKLSKETSM